MVRASTARLPATASLLNHRHQVLFKRKPVRFLPAVDIEDENVEVWLRSQSCSLSTITNNARSGIFLKLERSLLRTRIILTGKCNTLPNLNTFYSHIP
jgi:hypothetical protein